MYLKSCFLIFVNKLHILTFNTNIEQTKENGTRKLIGDNWISKLLFSAKHEERDLLCSSFVIHT